MDTGTTVQDAPELVVAAPSMARRGEPISRAVELLLARPESRMVYVVDDAGRLEGVVSWRDVLRVTKARFGTQGTGLFSLVELFRDLRPERVEQLMRRPTPVHLDTPMRKVMLLMHETHQNDLPIVDAEGRLVGEVNGSHIMRLALDVFRTTERDLDRARGG